MFTIGYVEHPLDYRFVRGGGLSLWTLEYLVAGSVAVNTAHGEQTYGADSVMLVPPLTPYAERWAGGRGDWKELYVVFAPPAHWKAMLAWPTSNCGLGILDLPNPTVRQEIESVLITAWEIRKSARANREALLINLLERVLLTLDEINPRRGYTQRDERIEKSLAFIATHFDETLSLSTLAREVYLSPSRFSHLFRAQMHLSPMQYLEQYRLERAAEKLLSGHDSIEQIATASGFVNAFHFSTRFRRHFKQSPSHYRRNPK